MGQWIDEQIKNGKLTAKMLYDRFNFDYVIGVGFYGRRAIAGPICVISCVLPYDHELNLVHSSELNYEECFELNHQVRDISPYMHIQWVGNTTMLRIPLDSAIFTAICAAISPVSVWSPCDLLIVDNYKMKRYPNGIQAAKIPVVVIERNGARICDILCACHVVSRISYHTIMQILDQEFPEYGWKTNLGFRTKEHINAIKEYGLTPYHRPRTFIQELGPNFNKLHPIYRMILEMDD